MLDIFEVLFKSESSVNAEQGFNNGVLYEPSNNPTFQQALCEKVVKGQNNTFIVFGRDRPGNLESGYGGKGHAKCGAIDIVVGRLSATDATTINGNVEPNVFADAARIYLSQKADIDDYYQLPEGKGISKAASAIAIKADDIRIMSRNSFKIVTGVDNRLSTGITNYINSGVQLICAGSDEELQPIPKGTNLNNALNQIVELMLLLAGTVDDFRKAQKLFNEELTNHVHKTPFYGIDSAPSEKVVKAGIKNAIDLMKKVEQELNNYTVNLQNCRDTYLLASSTETYINSSYHFLN